MSLRDARPPRVTVRRAAAVQVVAVLGALVAGVGPAAAHDAPDEGAAAWVMADWMLLTFLVFALSALVCFVVVLKRGLLRNLEDAKYVVLRIDEPDYYTPSWARPSHDEGGPHP